MVVIYCSEIDPGKKDVSLDKYINHFPEHLILQVRKFKTTIGQQQSFVGKLLLQRAFNDFRTGLSLHDLSYDVNNKPFVHSEFRFNISHSAELVVCAATYHCDLGIDIEFVNPIDVNEFKEQMTFGEWNRIISSSNPLQSFYTYWTEKESVLKAVGTGLFIPLDRFEITRGMTKLGGKEWYLRRVDINDKYICHLALDRQECPVKLINVKTMDEV
jgi:4'-phosphopantetheinyl transferase